MSQQSGFLDDAQSPAARCITGLRREGPTIGFVTAAIGLLVVFRGLLFAGINDDPPPVAEQLAYVWGEFIDHLAVALLILALVQPVRRFGPQSGMRRVVVLLAVALLATAIATAARVTWRLGPAEDGSFVVYWLAMYPRVAFVAVALLAVGEFHRSEVHSLEAMRRAEAARAALEQETLQARLRTLEAQIEPHFLFNTLANVRRLYELDALSGEAMLARLMHYLESALPSMREEAPTLEQEMRLIGDYLELQKVRLGRRLVYHVQVEPAALPVRVPPMMLLTLVENAIKHGLSRVREGGCIDVGAYVERGSLNVVVSDTGRGFHADTSGGGTGLANIRARLNAVFGSAAQVALEPNQPQGVRAVIRMPLGVL